jgi:L-alanine-DL-glutamate epimerase-like enolase superfamily enzyme
MMTASPDLKIESLRAVTLARAFTAAQWNPRMRWNTKRIVLAVVETAGGICGIGEAYCDGGDAASVLQLIERDLAPLAVGRSLAELGAVTAAAREAMVVSAKGGAAWAATSALDIALWDAWGRALQQPVSALLGATRRHVPAYASAGLYGPDKTLDDLAREMAGYVARGFRAVKIKVGGASLREDLARVAAVREAIGPDVRLMVDALYALDPHDALNMANELVRHDVYFLEAPVHPDDLDGLARVAAASPVRIAGNEFAYGLDGFRRILRRDAVSVVHLDAILCGGISEAMRIAALSAGHHRTVSFHAASSAVCFAANLQVAAAAPNVDSVEFHMLHDMLFDGLPEGTFRLVDGQVEVPTAAGLGLGVDVNTLLAGR